MHTISINLYTFGELAPTAQQKVIERERFITVDDPFWYEPIIEEWTEELQQRGLAAEASQNSTNRLEALCQGLRPGLISLAGYEPSRL